MTAIWPKRLSILLFILTMAIAFSWPVLTRLPNTGIWDWSEAVAHYESARLTIFDYGQFPLWNPYMCGGGPSLANPQTYWLSLTGALAIFIGPVIGSKLAIPLYIVIGGIGIYLLARRLGAGGIAAGIAMPIFLTSGFMATHLSAGQFLWLNLVWVPWIFWAYLKSHENWRWLIVSAAFLAIIGLEGRSYLIAYLAIALSSHALLTDFIHRTKGRAVASILLILVIAFSLGAWKFVPDLFFLAQAQSHLSNSPAIPLSLLPDMFFLPDVSANAEHAKLYFQDPMPWFEFGYYLGILPFILALLAFIPSNSRKTLTPWLAILIVFTYIVLSDPSQSLLEKIPLLNELRNQQRAASIFIFIIALLAAIGLHNFKYWWPRKMMRLLPVFQILVILYLALDLLSVTSPALAEGYAKGIKGDGLPPPRSPVIIQGEGFNDPWPLLQQNKGAANFCPAILYAWYPQKKVESINDEYYRNEVYLNGSGQVELFHVTPNIITARVNTEQPTMLVINQNANPGWRSNIGEVISTPQRLLAVNLPAGRHQVKLSYHPPGLKTGIAVTVLTALTLLAWHKYRQKQQGQ